MPRTQIQRFKPIDDLPNNVSFLWGQVIRELSFPETHGESEAAAIIRLHRTSVLEEIIRTQWDSTFRSGIKPPKNARGDIKLRANLWNKVIDLILKIEFISPSSTHPALLFGELMKEGQIECLHISAQTKSETIRLIQSQNQDLKALKNPFPPEYRYTHWFVERVLPIVGMMDRICTNNFTPMRQARENLTQHLRSEATLFEKEEEKGFAPVSGKRKNFREQLGNNLKPLPHKG
jgi:hypothetical protein